MINKKRIFRILPIIIALFLALSGIAAASGQQNLKVDGRLVDGVRFVDMSKLHKQGNIIVYRGDTVKLISPQMAEAGELIIPKYDISEFVDKGRTITVKFKAKDIGFFPYLIKPKNGDGGNAQSGNIKVIQYEAAGEAKYYELNAGQARNLISKKNPLILDVRTPMEFDQVRLENSTLIPVQHLAYRLDEIGHYKNNDILIYCRSGNRSTVAAAIMAKYGFKRLYNLHYGIKDWIKQGYDVVN